MIFQVYQYDPICHHSIPITTRVTSEVPDGPRSHFTVELRMSVWRDPRVEAPVASPWPQSNHVFRLERQSGAEWNESTGNQAKGNSSKPKFVCFHGFSVQRILNWDNMCHVDMFPSWKLPSYQVVHNEESSHVITSVEHTAPTAPPHSCFPTNPSSQIQTSRGLIRLICFELAFEFYYFRLIYMAIYDDS